LDLDPNPQKIKIKNSQGGQNFHRREPRTASLSLSLLSHFLQRSIRGSSVPSGGGRAPCQRSAPTTSTSFSHHDPRRGRRAGINPINANHVSNAQPQSILIGRLPLRQHFGFFAIISSFFPPLLLVLSCLLSSPPPDPASPRSSQCQCYVGWHPGVIICHAHFRFCAEEVGREEKDE
jgi:hypothetical protein